MKAKNTNYLNILTLFICCDGGVFIWNESFILWLGLYYTFRKVFWHFWLRTQIGFLVLDLYVSQSFLFLKIREEFITNISVTRNTPVTRGWSRVPWPNAGQKKQMKQQKSAFAKKNVKRKLTFLLEREEWSGKRLVQQKLHLAVGTVGQLGQMHSYLVGVGQQLHWRRQSSVGRVPKRPKMSGIQICPSSVIR